VPADAIGAGVFLLDDRREFTTTAAAIAGDGVFSLKTGHEYFFRP